MGMIIVNFWNSTNAFVPMLNVDFQLAVLMHSTGEDFFSQNL